MAIYHLTATVISRGRGQSIVAAAAYRCGAVLRDQRYGVTHNYQGKRGVVHAEIMAPSEAPEWVRNREALWNAVEAGENRKDAQLARLVEVGLPVELSVEERIDLVRDYVARQFVAQGMVADFCVRGEVGNPHAHILLTLRGLTSAGFGRKRRQWNGKSMLLEWRSAWANRANDHLARAGHAVRIDHRTLEAQQIELTPGRRIGIARARRGDATLPAHLAGRIDEQRRIANENGSIIVEDPTVALRALTLQRPIFTHEELTRFLRSRTGGEAQLDEALRAVVQSPDFVVLDPEAGLAGALTSRDMVEAQASLKRRATSLAARRGHGIDVDPPDAAGLDDGQRRAFEYVIGEGDAKALALTEADKEPILSASRRAWAEAGFAVVGSEWEAARDRLTRATVILVDGSHGMGIKELERVLAAADHARAKAVLVADSEQLRAMKAAPPFQSLLRQIGLN